MIFITIRTPIGTISLIVPHIEFIQAANLFEKSPDVINFKVNNGDSLLTQEQYGVSGYTKWVMQNYSNE